MSEDFSTNGSLLTEAATRIFSSYNPSDGVESQSTVIVGAGIIGIATAFYLSESGHTRPDTIHLVEASPELFTSATGKSGGFCTGDWYGPDTAELGELSFRLHRELAERFGGRENWGYSQSTGASLVLESEAEKAGRGVDWLLHGGSRASVAAVHEFKGHKDGPAWLLRGEGDQIEVLSEDGGVAQVNPKRLAHFILKECLKRGVRLHQPARPLRVSRDEAGDLSAIRLQHASGATFKLPCTRLVLTSGAWTPQVFSTLFPHSTLDLPISSLAGHSVVVKSPRWTAEHESAGCHAVFTTTPEGISPELFSRIDEGIYIAGLNDASLALPSDPAEESHSDPESQAKLARIAERLLGISPAELQVVKQGLCFRPVTPRGAPILTRVPDAELGGIETKAGAEGGVYIAAGHGPWGISQSLGTGCVMAELVERRERSADISRLGL